MKTILSLLLAFVASASAQFHGAAFYVGSPSSVTVGDIIPVSLALQHYDDFGDPQLFWHASVDAPTSSSGPLIQAGTPGVLFTTNGIFNVTAQFDPLTGAVGFPLTNMLDQVTVTWLYQTTPADLGLAVFRGYILMYDTPLFGLPGIGSASIGTQTRVVPSALRLTYNAVELDVAPGLQYILQSSTNLVDWLDCACPTEPGCYRHPIDPSAGQLFFRVSCSKPN